MKRIISFAAAILLCLSLSVIAFAGKYEVDSDGNAVYDTAIGYTFKIEDVDGQINGEDATVCTDVKSLDKCGMYAIWFTADKVSENLYVAAMDGTAMGGSKPSVSSLKEGSVIVVIHSASSRPEEADKYPNWEDKVAALAVKKGDYLHFRNIDLVSKTADDGKITVMTKDEAEKLPSDEPKPEESKPEESKPDESKAEESKPADESKPEEKPQESKGEDQSAVTSEMETGNKSNSVMWIIIGSVAAVIIIVIIVVLMRKKDKKD